VNLFDAAEAQRRKDAGMKKAADARGDLLNQAQAIARRIASIWTVVTADDVAMCMSQRGLRYEDLGNAAGSVFRSDFAWTGKVTPSIRASTHGRTIKVWRLK
jgi:hypothetical protein